MKPAQWVCLSAMALFLMGTAAQLQAPLTFWDSVLLEWANTPSPTQAPAGTSPLYLLSLKIMAQQGWADAVSVRCFQILGVLLTAWIVFCLANRLWKRPEAGSLACTLYLLNPAVIQGIQSLDMADTSFFPAFFSLWVLEFLSPEPRGPKRTLRLFLWGVLAMGMKITSSLGLVLYPVVALLLHKGKSRKEIGLDTLITLAGFTTFAVLWWSLQTWENIGVSTSTASRALHFQGFTSTIFHAATGLAWLGPFLGFLFMSGSLAMFKQNNERLKALLLGTGVYALGYLLIGGMNHGFPRYHMAVFPIVCAVAAYPSATSLHSGRFWASVLILAAAFWTAVGDPIHGLNVGLREALLEGHLTGLLSHQALRWAVWIGIPFSLTFLSTTPCLSILLSAALASSLALGAIQMRAPYLTAYGYGEQGRPEILQWVKENVPPGKTILTAPNLTPEVEKMGRRGSALVHWQTKGSMLEFLKHTPPNAVLLDLTGNTGWQLKWLLHNPPLELQACRNRYQRIGTFWACSLSHLDGRGKE